MNTKLSLCGFHIILSFPPTGCASMFKYNHATSSRVELNVKKFRSPASKQNKSVFASAERLSTKLQHRV